MTRADIRGTQIRGNTRESLKKKVKLVVRKVEKSKFAYVVMEDNKASYAENMEIEDDTFGEANTAEICRSGEYDGRFWWLNFELADGPLNKEKYLFNTISDVEINEESRIGNGVGEHNYCINKNFNCKDIDDENMLEKYVECVSEMSKSHIEEPNKIKIESLKRGYGIITSNRLINNDQSKDFHSLVEYSCSSNINVSNADPEHQASDLIVSTDSESDKQPIPRDSKKHLIIVSTDSESDKQPIPRDSKKHLTLWKTAQPENLKCNKAKKLRFECKPYLKERRLTQPENLKCNKAKKLRFECKPYLKERRLKLAVCILSMLCILVVCIFYCDTKNQ
ncbi:hypothetical protein QE152_g7006 [Popillia japonica]|uniref:Uncharacterized protein n=1 Tax=Popillia japonica TaxID=7064 RepID=A0AAW1MIC3_POPJA